MKRAVVLAALLLPASAVAGPQGQLLVGSAIPLDGDDGTSGTLNIAGKALWHFETGAAGIAAHWQPFFDGSNVRDQRVRLLAEGQVVLSDDGLLAWLLTGGVGAELTRVSSDSNTSGGDNAWSTDVVGEAGVCLAFTGWRFPPLLCLAVNAGLTTGDVEAVPLLGLRF